jgi:16S rRNA (cytosine1402-N4)-methyltransferase
MRMNQKARFSAKQLINSYSFSELSNILRKYGEIKNPGRVANEIIKYRDESEITTTGQLFDILRPLFKSKKKDSNKENQQLAQVFQALRIEVNNELLVLKELIERSSEILKPEGRLVVITYHSLEDRLVKNYIKHGIFEGAAEKDIFGNVDVPFKAINRKVITPSENEIKENNRARSAKLRIAEKL